MKIVATGNIIFVRWKIVEGTGLAVPPCEWGRRGRWWKEKKRSRISKGGRERLLGAHLFFLPIALVYEYFVEPSLCWAINCSATSAVPVPELSPPLEKYGKCITFTTYSHLPPPPNHSPSLDTSSPCHVLESQLTGKYTLPSKHISHIFYIWLMEGQAGGRSMPLLIFRWEMMSCCNVLWVMDPSTCCWLKRNGHRNFGFSLGR